MGVIEQVNIELLLPSEILLVVAIGSVGALGVSWVVCGRVVLPISVVVGAVVGPNVFNQNIYLVLECKVHAMQIFKDKIPTRAAYGAA